MFHVVDGFSDSRRGCFGPGSLAFFGGSSESQADTNTSSNTTNNASSVDRRVVSSDSAVAVSGDSNNVNRSTNTSTATNFTDTSNRSSSSITEFMDNSNRSSNFSDTSNRSTTFTDTSNRSTNTNIQATDFGSVAQSLSGMKGVADNALGLTGGVLSQVLNGLKIQATQNNASFDAAVNLAGRAAANQNTTIEQAMGLVRQQANDSAGAIQSIGKKSQAYMVFAVLGAVAVGFLLLRGAR